MTADHDHKDALPLATGAVPSPTRTSHPASGPAHAQAPSGRMGTKSPAFRIDLVGIMSAMQETAYLWDVTTDTIVWESNAPEVLGLASDVGISTGTAFQLLIVPEHLQRRRDAVAIAGGAAVKGPHYRVQYRFTPGGRRADTSIWLEDHGSCWFGEDGRLVKSRGIIRVINDRYRDEQTLLYRSDNDELTGQLNRIRLTDALGAFVSRAEQSGRSCGFLIAAVNNLAIINDTFGFDIGDEVIAATAQVLRGRLRGGDTIGRYSSNKFGIILNDCGPAAMRVAAERFIKAVRETTIRTTACQISATLSIGGVLLPDQAHTAQQALSRALQAVETVKSRRHDAFVPFEVSDARETTRQRNIMVADEIISAFNENRMLLALQPIVSMRDRKPAFYECLLRIERPDGIDVSAGDFNPVAEQLGLSRLIDRRTLELSIAILKKNPELHLSVNVSGLTASDHEWLVILHRLSGGRRALTERLTIEITETATIHYVDLSINFVDTLKELGCRVAIDDFGAGYTSFKNLKLLDVDMVKIDGTFVQNLSTEPSNRVFIRSLVEIAKAFGLETVAEWVGDEETARILDDCGITYMQGFHFGRPLIARDLPSLAGGRSAQPA